MVSIFLAFEAPQEHWDVLLNSLKTIADLHLLGSMGLIKCQDVSVGLDLFSQGSFSEFNSDRFCFVFLFEDTIDAVIFFAGPVLHHPWSPTCVGNVPRGKVIHLG